MLKYFPQVFTHVEARLNPELVPKSNQDKIEWKYQLGNQFKQLDICEENRTWLLMGPWDQIQEARKCIQLWLCQSLNVDNEFGLINGSTVRQNHMDDVKGHRDGRERSSSFNKKLGSAVSSLLNEEERDSGSESKEDIDDEAVEREMKELPDHFANVDIEDMDKNMDNVRISRRPKEHRSAVKSLQHREEEDNAYEGKEDTEDEAIQREINEIERMFADIDMKGTSTNKNNEDMMNGRPEGDGTPKTEETAANRSRQTSNSCEQVISSFWSDTGNKTASLSMVQRDQLDGGASSTVGTSATSPLLSCTMHNGTEIYLYMADITGLRVGAIVNAANERLQHGGGVALAIATAIGPSFQRDSDRYIKKNGKVPLACVAVQSTNSRIPSRHVINAVGPTWGKFRNKEECKTKLMCTFLQCLKCANEKCKVRSVAVPLISSGEHTCNY